MAVLITALLLVACGGQVTPSNAEASANPNASPPATAAPVTGASSWAPTDTSSVAPTTRPRPATSPPVALSRPAQKIHTVVAGDTLTDIAEHYGVTLQGLIAANPQIGDPGLIRVGDRIAISPIDLGPGDAVAVNNRGQIVINTMDGHAFLWEEGSRTDLGSLGDPGTLVADINERGQVVGGSGGDAFLWQEGVMTDLGTLGGHESEAVAINDLGQVVGWSEIASSEEFPPRPAFLWRDGAMVDLSPLGSPYGVSRQTVAINDLGQVVGVGTNDAGEQHVFLWDDGRLTDLGPFGPGPVSVAINDRGEVVVVAAGPADVAINNAGEIAGSRSLSDMVWNGDIYRWRDGVLSDLGPLRGGFLWADGGMIDPGSAAVAINDLGQVVGWSLTDIPAPHPGIWCCSTVIHAFRWQDGAAVDLGTLGPLDGSSVAAINDCGQAVGRTYDDAGDGHAVLWQVAAP